MERQSPVYVSTPGVAKSRASELEWRVVDIPRHLSRAEVHALIAAQVEQGKWELARSALFYGGARRLWLKRRILRVQDVREQAIQY